MSFPNPENITADQIIREMTDLGYDFRIFHHAKHLTGYGAKFYKGDNFVGAWADAGHGDTFEEAVVEALAVAVIGHTPRPSREFELSR